MAKDPAWKNNSSGDLLQFDFAPPAKWTEERVRQEQAAIAAALSDAAGDDKAASGWLTLAQRLPDGLKAALLAELRAGNLLTGIGSSGWPSEGSIVVNMRERFTAARTDAPAGVIWRELNDPHYCREELSQKAGDVEYLIIT